MNERTPFGIVCDMQSVGGRIRRVRKLARETQAQFAVRLGNVSRGAVGNWERDRGIKTENLRMITAKYPVDFNWLATGRGPAPREGGASLVARAESANVELPMIKISPCGF